MNVTITCPCPGNPHPDGDTITLRDKLDFLSAHAIRWESAILTAVWKAANNNELPPTSLTMAKMSEATLLYAIEAWTLIDENGKPIAPLRPAIGRFIESHPTEAGVVAEEADELYGETVSGPLFARAAKSLPSTPTDDSISPLMDSSTNKASPPNTPSDGPTLLPMPSSPSSTTSTPTADTATTSASPAGDSSTSPSSASAA